MFKSKKSFGTISTGNETHLYTLSNDYLQVTVTDYGAAIVSLTVNDTAGRPVDVVLGYDCASAYETGTCYFGAIVGRVANRISGAAFTLNGNTYVLDANEGENCLHGGFFGYQHRIWETIREPSANDASCTLRMVSPAMDQGFPGNLTLLVTYSLQDRFLSIHYHAVSDADTLLNVTNHSYFNLNGHSSGTILNHSLQIAAKAYTPVQNSACIPDGRQQLVEGTPFDFRTPKMIGCAIDADDEQLLFGRGYDHNYVLSQEQTAMQPAATARGDISGITMEVFTDLPGIQFYAGNSITPQKGKNGSSYNRRCGFCLETQYFPNSIHTLGFTPCILHHKETWESTTRYQFSANTVH